MTEKLEHYTREEEEEYLRAWITQDEKEIELRLQDHDLWVYDPASRYEFEGAEAVRQWEHAARMLHALFEMYFNLYDVEHEALIWTLGDARDRAKEAARRARERLQDETTA